MAPPRIPSPRLFLTKPPCERRPQPRCPHTRWAEAEPTHCPPQTKLGQERPEAKGDYCGTQLPSQKRPALDYRLQPLLQANCSLVATCLLARGSKRNLARKWTEAQSHLEALGSRATPSKGSSRQSQQGQRGRRTRPSGPPLRSAAAQQLFLPKPSRPPWA